MNPRKRRAVFLDRDGTLIEEVNYCSHPEQVHVIEGVVDGLQRLKAAGFLLLVVSNQSGIGRGYFSETDYAAVHAEMLRQLGDSSLLDAEYHCSAMPDEPDPRRKPAPGMLLEAAEVWNIDLPASFMIGDKESDLMAGTNAGTRSLLVQTGYGKSVTADADFIAESFLQAADWILEQL